MVLWLLSSKRSPQARWHAAPGDRCHSSRACRPLRILHISGLIKWVGRGPACLQASGNVQLHSVVAGATHSSWPQVRSISACQRGVDYVRSCPLQQDAPRSSPAAALSGHTLNCIARGKWTITQLASKHLPSKFAWAAQWGLGICMYRITWVSGFQEDQPFGSS